MAFIGGSLSIEKEVFEILLFLVLTIAGFLLIFNFKSFEDEEKVFKKVPILFSSLIGGSIGFISGVIGIGGGIFLSPILLLIKAGKAKHIATISSLFILINSIAGLSGQLSKNFVLNELSNYWLILLLVFIGGQLGNFLNIKIFPPRLLVILTSILVLFVALRVGYKLFI